MYLLCDATSAYASWEKIFEPAIRNRPVLVAGSNDGVVISICPVAKRLGLKKFEPVFLQQELIKRTGAIVRSANFEQYGEISRRMHAVLAQYGHSHPYSIDESFILLNFSQKETDWFELGRSIRRRLWDEARVPICCGFGETLTLAKASSHASKRLPGYRGVAVIHNENDRQRILKQMDVEDVWGIGSRIGKRLKLIFSIKTALDLANADRVSMRRAFNVNVANTISELNGESALFWDDIRADKKQIFSTRTVSRPIQCQDDLKRALLSHALNVCRKSRSQKSLLSELVIFARTSRFQDGPDKIFNCLLTFSAPTNCYKKVAAEVIKHVDLNYRPGADFKKVGAGAIALVPELYSMSDLFGGTADDVAFADTIDAINKRFGNGTVSLGAALNANAATFLVGRNNLSPRYLTAWHELPRVLCK